MEKNNKKIGEIGFTEQMAKVETRDTLIPILLTLGFKLSTNRALDGSSASEWVEYYDGDKWECYFK